MEIIKKIDGERKKNYSKSVETIRNNSKQISINLVSYII